MRAAVWMVSAAVAALVISPLAQAQDGRRSRQPSGSGSAAPAPPLSDNPVKRTWDFTKRFGIPRFTASTTCAGDAAEFDSFIRGYNARVDEFLAGPSDAKKLGLERKNYVRQVLGTERDIDTYLRTYQETGSRGPDSDVPALDADLCRAATQRRHLLAIREGLKAVGRVYPDMAEVAPMLAKANAALTRMGDDKALATFVKANRARSLAAVRLKPAVSRNAEWEGALRGGFTRLRPGEAVLKLHLYSANWYVHKNELTAVPEYRQIGAWVAARRSDGTCWIYSVDLWQDYVGGGFSGGEYKLDRAPRQILCENV